MDSPASRARSWGVFLVGPRGGRLRPRKELLPRAPPRTHTPTTPPVRNIKAVNFENDDVRVTYDPDSLATTTATTNTNNSLSTFPTISTTSPHAAENSPVNAEISEPAVATPCSSHLPFAASQLTTLKHNSLPRNAGSGSNPSAVGGRSASEVGFAARGEDLKRVDDMKADAVASTAARVAGPTHHPRHPVASFI
jgi:hypothetical protein